MLLYYSVRSQSGTNEKSSVFHSFVRDHRDDAVLPTRGHYLGIYQELAGLGGRGDTSYLKHELNASYHQSLIDSKSKDDAKFVLSTSFRAGLFSTVLEAPKGSDGPKISDRFYVGGPTSVRGFKMGGIREAGKFGLDVICKHMLIVPYRGTCWWRGLLGCWC